MMAWSALGISSSSIFITVVVVIEHGMIISPLEESPIAQTSDKSSFPSLYIVLDGINIKCLYGITNSKWYSVFHGIYN